MNFDIRLPIGVMFFLIGLMLFGYGLAVGPSGGTGTDEASNINAWWGSALLLFGLAMLALAWRAHRRATR